MDKIPENLKPIFSEFAKVNKEKYEENWKEIVSKQIADDCISAMKRDGLIKGNENETAN